MQPRSWMVLLFVFLSTNSPAASLYVDLHSAHPIPPYASWETAATTIQDAIDAAQSGDEVVVTNGVYNTGGKVGPTREHHLMNRICVSQPIVIRSVNGPEVTIIEGQPSPGTLFGTNSVRCALLGGGAQLHGFTLQNGSTEASIDDYFNSRGGGVMSLFQIGYPPVLSNCVIQANAALNDGGGAYGVNMYRSTVRSNWAAYGASAVFAGYIDGCELSRSFSEWGTPSLMYCNILNSLVTENNGGSVVVQNSMLRNSTVVFNQGGVVQSTISNSIVFYNTAPDGRSFNYQNSQIQRTCTFPLPTEGEGNIDADPQLVTPSRLGATSPCRGAGIPIAECLSDLGGVPWANPPSMGCNEFVLGAQRGPLTVRVLAEYNYPSPSSPVELRAEIIGRANGHRWDFGDGTVVTNQPITSHAWQREGDYSITLTAWSDDFPEGVVAVQRVSVMQRPIHYVNVASTNPVPPFTTWSTAARVIQDAVDAATPGSTVLVAKGVYRTGGRSAEPGVPLSRVHIGKSLTIQSVDGAEETIIEGSYASLTSAADLPVRCAFLRDHASLVGFTLTGGGTYLNFGPSSFFSGGGVWCESTNVNVSDCVFSKNHAGFQGGGATGGTFRNCLFLQNSAPIGGGVASATLERCTLRENQADNGGGAAICRLSRCKLQGNTAGNGSTAYSAVFSDCLIVDLPNGAFGGPALEYISLFHSTVIVQKPSRIDLLEFVQDCLIYYADGASAMGDIGWLGPIPRPSDFTEFRTDPGFVDAPHGDYHLRFDSPAVNAGRFEDESTVDLDGNARIVGANQDLGAYEVQSFDLPAYEDWLRFFQLPLDGSEDTDRDGVANGEEWRAGTDPTNPQSAPKLKVSLISPAEIVLSWAATPNRAYVLEEAGSLEGGVSFHELTSGIWNTTHTTSLAQWTNAITPSSHFFRLRLQQ